MEDPDTARASAFARAFEDSETTEHVLLEGDDGPGPDAAPGRVVREIDVVDRARRIVTALELLDNGRLTLRRGRRGRPGPAQTIDLTYLDTVPSVERRFAKRAGWTALGLLGCAALAAASSRLGVPGATAGTIAASAAAGAVAAFALFVSMSRERVTFRTRHGRAAALTLTATLGSLGAQRKAVPLVAAAIEQARAALGDDTHVYLKREMHEHYRLRSEGVLSEAECADGTARVLARFDAVP